MISTGVRYCFGQKEKDLARPVDELTVSRNEELDQEEVFGTIEAVKTVSDLFMPISGKVDSFNKELEDSPELINDDPYNNGWIISVSDFDESELETLLSADDYKKLVE